MYFSIYNHNILMSNCFVNSCSYILSVRQLSECWLPYAFSPYLKESLDGFGKHWKRKKRRVFSIPNFMRIFGNTCSFGRKARIYVGKSILYNLSKWKCRSFRYYFRLRIINKSTTCDVIYKEGTGRKCSLTGKWAKTESSNIFVEGSV